MEKMTIHRGLSELKLIDSKIQKQISEIAPTGTYQKGKLVANYIPQADFEKSAQSKYQSVVDLIERKRKIKTLIVIANATTYVKIGKETMTIADAITSKSYLIFKKDLLNTLKLKQKSSVAELNRLNDAIGKNIQAILEATFGKDNVKVGSEDVEAVRRPYIESNEFHLFDPLKVTEKIEELQNEISEFEAEVDAVLSEVNATTFIEL